MGMSDDELKQFFVYEAKLGMNPGTVFGTGGSGFMRMNIGTTRTVIQTAMERMVSAFEGLNGAEAAASSIQIPECQLLLPKYLGLNSSAGALLRLAV